VKRKKILSLLCVLLMLALPSIVNAGTLNRSAVRAYAYGFATKYNPLYRSFGNDCQNFVSQALRAGGWTDTSEWWYLWFYQSLPWVNANDFYNFVKRSGRATLTNDPTQLDAGDILQVDWDGNGKIDHSMIVTRKDSNNGTAYLTYHSGFNGPVVDKPHWQLRYAPNDPHLILYPKLKFYGWRLKTKF
jgi:Putative amidase domain